MTDAHNDPPVTHGRDNKFVDQDDDYKGDESKIRERRTFAAATPAQLNNYRLGLLQEKEYARQSKDSERESAVDAELGKLGDHHMTSDSDPDIVSVGPSSYDINSSYTVRPAASDVQDGTIRGDGDAPRGVAQPPDIVSIPNPGAHTAAVAARNAEQVESNRPASVGGVPVADGPAGGPSSPPPAGSKADRAK